MKNDQAVGDALLEVLSELQESRENNAQLKSDLQASYERNSNLSEIIENCENKIKDQSAYILDLQKSAASLLLFVPDEIQVKEIREMGSLFHEWMKVKDKRYHQGE